MENCVPRVPCALLDLPSSHLEVSTPITLVQGHRQNNKVIMELSRLLSEGFHGFQSPASSSFGEPT